MIRIAVGENLKIRKNVSTFLQTAFGGHGTVKSNMQLVSLISGQNIDRKVFVIFETDIIAYSKHKEADERETIFALHECEAILLG